MVVPPQFLKVLEDLDDPLQNAYETLWTYKAQHHPKALNPNTTPNKINILNLETPK